MQNINVGVAILVLVLGAALAPIYVISAGQSGWVWGPIVSDIVEILAAATMLPVTSQTRDSAIMKVLICGAVAMMTGTQIEELTVDYKIGMFLNVPIRQQWLAQMLGCVIAVFLAPAMFVVYAKAYPCILDASAVSCVFGVPAAITKGMIPLAFFKGSMIARSSWIFGIVAGVVTVGVQYLRFWARQTGRTRLRRWVPNMLLVGLGVVLGGFQIAFGMMIGSVIAWLWLRKWPRTHAVYLLPIAAGMITGESIAGIFNAVLEICKVSGSYHGTSVGCPPNMC